MKITFEVERERLPDLKAELASAAARWRLVLAMPADDTTAKWARLELQLIEAALEAIAAE
jgi:hypothetical protein